MPDEGILTSRLRLDASLLLVGAAGAALGALLLTVLVAFVHLGFWTAVGTAGACLAAALATRGLDAAAAPDDAARRRLSLRALLAGAGAGMLAAGVYLNWRIDMPGSLVAAGILLLATGWHAYRKEAYRQHVLEVADV